MAKKKSKSKKAAGNRASAKKATKKKEDHDKGYFEFTPAQKKANKKATGEFNKLFDQPRPDELVQIEEEENFRFVELMEQRDQARKVLESKRDELMKDRVDLSGLHVGYRRSDGKIKFPLEVCIVMSVREKLAIGSPRMMATALPETIEEVPIDIVRDSFSRLEMPVPRTLPGARATSVSLPSKKRNPICGGVAIAHPDHPNEWGTLGFPFQQNGKVVLLTCQHVVQSSSGANSPVVQPPSMQTERIGVVDPSNVAWDLDAALITADTDREIVQALAWGSSHLDVTIGLGDAVKGQRVFQMGAKSGKHRGLGYVEDIDATVKLENGRQFDKQILVKPEDDSLPVVRSGDSGAVLVHRVSDDLVEIIGLVYGKTESGGLVACHRKSIFDRFLINL
jgi:hypothetical protein